VEKDFILCQAVMYNLTFSMYLPHLPFNIVIFCVYFVKEMLGFGDVLAG
jgi:hypothetical protein